MVVPFFILSSAVTYFVMSDGSPTTFSEPLTRTDSLYFALMVFSTVGQGDISPATEAGRIAVTIQMAVNVLVVGIGIRVVTSAVQHTRDRKG